MVRRRSLRRPIPALIFLLVLAMVAVFVWWKILERDQELRASTPAPCVATSAAPVSLDPATVQIRVFNATDTEGLAGQVGGELSQRGLRVTAVANDPSGRDVQGVGELRYGELGAGQASFVAANFPGLVWVPDGRDSALVDVAIGPAYVGMVPPEQVPAALASGVSGGPTSPSTRC